MRYRASLLDAAQAAAHFGYRYFDDWQVLSQDDQAYLIAAYQLRQELDMVVAWDQAREAARRSRRSQRT